tara:strand:- start:703 stop:1101 length:399 start_codon:yes stop_codon:yes gene_type:complete
MKKSSKILENELIQALKQAKEVDALLKKEQVVTTSLHSKLMIAESARIKENTAFQKQIQDLLKEKTKLQSALKKSKDTLDKVGDLINFFTTEILKADGTFPKLNFFNLGKIFKIAVFLATFIPELIAIFKKK